VDLSSDGRHALSGGADGVVCLWDLSGARPGPSR
jgi:WD40 repeat protein